MVGTNEPVASAPTAPTAGDGTLQTRPRSRAASLVVVGIAYVVAAAVAVVTFQVVAPLSPSTGFWSVWAPLLGADVAATVAIFACSLLLKNHSTYDPYWSVAPIALAIWLLMLPPAGDPARRVVVVSLLVLWALRLTWNWASGWEGLHHEDWRYRQIAQQTGRAFPLASFVGIHLMPTLLVFLGCLPLRSALQGGAAMGWVDAVAVAVTGSAIALEAVADRQMRAFLARPLPPGGERPVLDEGVWAWSRHPNYLGEIAFWLGLFLFAVGAGGTAADCVGFIAMVVLFSVVSIPLMERRQAARRAGYGAYQRRVPMLVPWRRPQRGPA